jgi:hypothetical protein
LLLPFYCLAAGCYRQQQLMEKLTGGLVSPVPLLRLGSGCRAWMVVVVGVRDVVVGVGVRMFQRLVLNSEPMNLLFLPLDFPIELIVRLMRIDFTKIPLYSRSS